MSFSRRARLAAPSAESSLAWGLGAELAEQARGRLLRLAWALLAVYGVGVCVTLVFQMAGVGTALHARATFVALVVSSVLTIGVIALVRDRRRSHRVALVAGVVLEWFLCAVAASVGTLTAWERDHAVPEVTWLEPLIVVFPLVVPLPPRFAAFVALTAAWLAPATVWALGMFTGVEAAADTYVRVLVPALFAAGLATYASRIAHGLSRDAADARRMGSYLLEERIGAGGMGEVWRARHRFLARPAAIKMVLPDRATETFARRFEREAQVTATLRSIHTVELYDFGRADDGAFFYVMELLEGVDLHTLVQRWGPVPPERVIHLLVQACDSLAEAHEHDLVHRDIKPANLFLTRLGIQTDVLKVLDFGLAAGAGRRETASPDLTVAGTQVGTPAFMAPETISRGETSPASDLYALGAVAYWLITGRPLFERDDAMQMAVAHVTEAPLVPSTQVETPIPPALDAIVLQCLAKSPGDRPVSARDLAATLRAIVRERDWSADRADQWWDTHHPEAFRSHESAASSPSAHATRYLSHADQEPRG